MLNIKSEVHIIIDYFAATFPFRIYEDDFELKVIQDIVNYISDFIGIDKDIIEKQDYAQNRFSYQYKLGENITLRLCGPVLKSGYKSCSIELKGDGCREFEEVSNKSWFDFLEFFLVRLNASPTRIDIAIDDYDGIDITLLEIKRKLDLKYFTTSFKDKDYIIHGNDKKGISLQFGSHKSSQMLVIYEKLKEQLTKGIECFQTYWLRYEIRYTKDNAYNVCMDIINKGEPEYNNYIFGLLYTMLDLKIDNNYDEDNQHKVETDNKWKSFLNNASKAKVEKYKNKKSTYETYLKWSKSIVSFYLLNILVHQGNDITSFNITIYNEIINLIHDFNKKKLYKLNLYMKESGLEMLDIKDIFDLEVKLKNLVDTLELPF